MARTAAFEALYELGIRSRRGPYDKWEDGMSAMRDDMLTILATRWLMRSGRKVLMILN